MRKFSRKSWGKIESTNQIVPRHFRNAKSEKKMAISRKEAGRTKKKSPLDC